MNEEETIKQIAEQLRFIDREDMSPSEIRICNILIKTGEYKWGRMEDSWVELVPVVPLPWWEDPRFQEFI